MKKYSHSRKLLQERVTGSALKSLLPQCILWITQYNNFISLIYMSVVGDNGCFSHHLIFFIFNFPPISNTWGSCTSKLTDMTKEYWSPRGWNDSLYLNIESKGFFKISFSCFYFYPSTVTDNSFLTAMGAQCTWSKHVGAQRKWSKHLGPDAK